MHKGLVYKQKMQVQVDEQELHRQQRKNNQKSLLLSTSHHQQKAFRGYTSALVHTVFTHPPFYLLNLYGTAPRFASKVKISFWHHLRHQKTKSTAKTNG